MDLKQSLSLSFDNKNKTMESSCGFDHTNKILGSKCIFYDHVQDMLINVPETHQCEIKPNLDFNNLDADVMLELNVWGTVHHATNTPTYVNARSFFKDMTDNNHKKFKSNPILSRHYNLTDSRMKLMSFFFEKDSIIMVQNSGGGGQLPEIINYASLIKDFWCPECIKSIKSQIESDLINGMDDCVVDTSHLHDNCSNLESKNKSTPSIHIPSSQPKNWNPSENITSISHKHESFTSVLGSPQFLSLSACRDSEDLLSSPSHTNDNDSDDDNQLLLPQLYTSPIRNVHLSPDTYQEEFQPTSSSPVFHMSLPISANLLIGPNSSLSKNNDDINKDDDTEDNGYKSDPENNEFFPIWSQENLMNSCLGPSEDESHFHKPHFELSEFLCAQQKEDITKKEEDSTKSPPHNLIQLDENSQKISDVEILQRNINQSMDDELIVNLSTISVSDESGMQIDQKEDKKMETTHTKARQRKINKNNKVIKKKKTTKTKNKSTTSKGLKRKYRDENSDDDSESSFEEDDGGIFKASKKLMINLPTRDTLKRRVKPKKCSNKF